MFYSTSCYTTFVLDIYTCSEDRNIVETIDFIQVNDMSSRNPCIDNNVRHLRSPLSYTRKQSELSNVVTWLQRADDDTRRSHDAHSCQNATKDARFSTGNRRRRHPIDRSSVPSHQTPLDCGSLTLSAIRALGK